MTKKISWLSSIIGLFAAAAVILTASPFVLPSAVQATELYQGTLRAQANFNFARTGIHHLPTGRGWGVPDATGRTEAAAQKYSRFSKSTPVETILYHGGPIMPGTVNLYYIWYGAWNFTTNNTNQILDSFGGYVGGTPYFNINQTYNQLNGTSVSGLTSLFHLAAVDSGSGGASLSDAGVQTVVTRALANGSLPYDANGVYVVLTSKEVKETSGFCTQYCGWHNHAAINGHDIKFAFIGSPLQCPTSCAAQTVGPNGNMEADGMASIMAHEITEAITDPDFTGWYDAAGNETSDKCAWQFGNVARLKTGAYYNTVFGGRPWLLQELWENSRGGFCTMTK